MILDVTAAITYLHDHFYFHIAATDSWQCNTTGLIKCTLMYPLITLTLSITTINLRLYNLSTIIIFYSCAVIFSCAVSGRYCVVQYSITTSLSVPLQSHFIFCRSCIFLNYIVYTSAIMLLLLFPFSFTHVSTPNLILLSLKTP